MRAAREPEVLVSPLAPIEVLPLDVPLEPAVVLLSELLPGVLLTAESVLAPPVVPLAVDEPVPLVLLPDELVPLPVVAPAVPPVLPAVPLGLLPVVAVLPPVPAPAPALAPVEEEPELDVPAPAPVPVPLEPLVWARDTPPIARAAAAARVVRVFLVVDMVVTP